MHLAPQNSDHQARKLPLNFKLTYISKSSRASPNPTSLRFEALNGAVTLWRRPLTQSSVSFRYSSPIKSLYSHGGNEQAVVLKECEGLTCALEIGALWVLGNRNSPGCELSPEKQVDLKFFLMSWKPCHMSFSTYFFDGFYILWCHSEISWEQHNGLRSNKKHSSSSLRYESSLPFKPLMKAWIERVIFYIYILYININKIYTYLYI